MLIFLFSITSLSAQEIIHDAEQAILQEQFGEQWAKQDKEVAKKLATWAHCIPRLRQS